MGWGTGDWPTKAGPGNDRHRIDPRPGRQSPAVRQHVGDGFGDLLMNGREEALAHQRRDHPLAGQRGELDEALQELAFGQDQRVAQVRRRQPTGQLVVAWFVAHSD